MLFPDLKSSVLFLSSTFLLTWLLLLLLLFCLLLHRCWQLEEGAGLPHRPSCWLSGSLLSLLVLTTTKILGRAMNLGGGWRKKVFSPRALLIQLLSILLLLILWDSSSLLATKPILTAALSILSLFTSSGFPFFFKRMLNLCLRESYHGLVERPCFIQNNFCRENNVITVFKGMPYAWCIIGSDNKPCLYIHTETGHGLWLCPVHPLLKEFILQFNLCWK